MELKQVKTLMDVRRGFLMAVLSITVVAILVAGVISNYFFYSIPIFTICVFAIFIVVLSIFYDIYINSTYRIFIVDGEVYIYYPTYSSRAGNEFIFYRVKELEYSTVKGSSILFNGTVEVRTEGVEREGMKEVTDPKALFDEIFSGETYSIHKKFRISRIFENENELMVRLAEKRKK